VGVDSALRAAVYAQGSDAPKKSQDWFYPLTDCASIVMTPRFWALTKKYGVKIIPSKRKPAGPASTTRLVTGGCFAHMLLGQTYGVHLNWRHQEDMAVLTLNHNGQVSP
jgi:nitrate/nitrite transport system substrate-binding protein